MKYFEEILAINKKYFPEDNIRIDDLTKVYKLLETFYSKEFDLDEFLKLCTILFNMQIFFDGNSRTIINYMTQKLEENGYIYELENATKNIIALKAIFPTMYDLNEPLDEADLEKLKKNIYPKERKEEEYDNSNNRTNRGR